MRTGESQGEFGYSEEGKLSASSGVQTADRPARSRVITPTDPSRFNVYTQHDILSKTRPKGFEINIGRGAITTGLSANCERC